MLCYIILLDELFYLLNDGAHREILGGSSNHKEIRKEMTAIFKKNIQRTMKLLNSD